MTTVTTRPVERRSGRNPGAMRWALVIAVTALLATGILQAADVARSGTSSQSSVDVPGFGVTARHLPAAWSMRPDQWVITRVESGDVVTATSTWWPEPVESDRHNTFEVCVESVDQAACPRSGPLVVSTVELSADARASVSIVPRTPEVTNRKDVEAWKNVVFE
jgi:hypothetical protein